MIQNRIKSSIKAALYHFVFCAMIAAMVAWLVFVIWYPSPYRELAGGLHLFWVLIGVDVVCGPLLTAIIFNPLKSKKELSLDISLVALIQCAALIYGLFSLYQARPVALVYEVDRFVVVTQAQIYLPNTASAFNEYTDFSIFGKPKLLAIREAQSGDETLESIELSMKGVEPSVRPNWWQSYEPSRDKVKSRMKPLASLYAKGQQQKSAIDRAMMTGGFSVSASYYLPLVSAKLLDSWSVVLDRDALIIGYARVDGFSDERR